MYGGARKTLCFVSLIALAVMYATPAAAQNLRNMVVSQQRVFPQVSGGVIAMKEDAAGHFYVLANPGHSVLIFDANGNQTGQIPNANSGDLTLRYAVDLDIAKNGDLLVADRGANQVDIFAADGSLKTKFAVFAPTSLVALSNGQFAVTTLRPEHPVEVIDDQGRVVRGFGEAHDDTNVIPNSPTNPAPLADTGRIVGDSADNLYFAMLSASDREIRKYDRFGYAAYATTVPAPASNEIANTPDDRIQYTFNFMRLNRSEQINSWATVGASSGKVQFGSNVGLGLTGLMGGAGRGGYGGRGGAGTGTVAGTITGDTSLASPTFDLHLGLKANERSAKGSGSADNGQQGGNSSTGSASTATLQYTGSGSSSSSDADRRHRSRRQLFFQYIAVPVGGRLLQRASGNPGLYDRHSPSGLRTRPGSGRIFEFLAGRLGPEALRFRTAVFRRRRHAHGRRRGT